VASEKKNDIDVGPIEENPFRDWTADQLIKYSNELKDFKTKEDARFKEYMAPTQKMIAQIEAVIGKMFVDQNIKNLKTEFGTAYVSVLMNYKIENRELFLKSCLDNWTTFGGALLSVGSTVEPIKQFMEANNGSPPPGMAISWFSRINIRRS
jgi:hypothetical protein